jgi:beta-glucosidase
LQEELGFQGVVLADWCVISDLPNPDVVGDLAEAKAWGVEHLDREERIIRALEAGVDQFGGEYCEDVLIKVIKDGRVSEERINRSARKLLKDKFELGLFDNPYVDVEAAEKIVGRADFKAAGLKAQKDSLTLLSNNSVLPLSTGVKLYVEGFKDPIPSRFGSTVTSPSDADFAILRIRAPYETFGKGAFARNHHHGSLEYPQAELDRIAEMSKQTKVILNIFTDRPLVLGSLATDAAAVILDYGASDEAVLSVLFGESSPMGKLPFDLPRSNAAVAESRADVPFDTKEPVYRFGHGLRY